MAAKNYSFTLDSTLGDTPEIDVSNATTGMIYIPTGSGITGLTYYSAANSGGTYLPAYDAAGNAVVQTVAQTRSYAMPAAVFGAGVIKIVTNADGAVTICLK